MDIGSLFLILALLVLVVMFITRPLMERKPVAAGLMSDEEDHEISALLAERDRILNALQELDFDHSLGKIPDEDYPSQRSILLQNGAETLRKLDTLLAGPSGDDVEARIEAAIAARGADAGHVPGAAVAGRVRNQVVQVAVPDDDIEALLANRRRARHEKAAGFCPQCGGPVQVSDRFCPKCGSPLG